jgi:hypothetical protein
LAKDCCEHENVIPYKTLMAKRVLGSNQCGAIWRNYTKFLTQGFYGRENRENCVRDELCPLINRLPRATGERLNGLVARAAGAPDYRRQVGCPVRPTVRYCDQPSINRCGAGDGADYVAFTAFSTSILPAHVKLRGFYT